MLENFDPQTKEVIGEISKFKFVKAIYIFGSVQKGKATRISDIDICIIDDESFPLKERYKIYQYSEHQFDVSLFSQLSLPIQYEALKGDCIFCRDKQYIIDLKPKVWFEYFDMQPVWEEGIKIRKKAGYRVVS